MITRSSSASRSAFTLVELMISCTLAGIVLAAVVSSYVTLTRNFTRSLGVASSNQPTLESQGRRTLSAFATDVQQATGLLGTPSNNRVDLILPTGTGTDIITYYYNSSVTATNVTVSGVTVSMAANSITRCVSSGNTVTTRILQTNIPPPLSPAPPTTHPLPPFTDACYFRYYDSSGKPYDSGVSPYTTVTTYSSGIKQLSLNFSTQAGSRINGTLSPIYPSASPRFILRNKQLLQ